MAAMNLEGSLFMCNFELGNSSSGLYQPYFSAKETRNNDFAFADKESLIGAVSLKEKSFCVYDTLLPSRQSQILVAKGNNIAGNLLLLHQKSGYRAFTFNSRPGYVSEIDLRKVGSDNTVHKVAPCVVNSQQLSREDITAVTFDQD
jgi:hypothetical protein